MGDEKPLVLLAEDERDLADLYSEWLEKEYSVVKTYNGQSAIGQLSRDIDVALLDRRMPDISGDKVLMEILERGIDCQVAMVTAVEPEFDILAMGFDDYITKPINEFEIRELVDRLHTLRSYEDSIQAFYRLASKKAALEAAKSPDELDQNEGFSTLKSDLDDIRKQSDETLDQINDKEDFFTLF